MIGYVTIKSDLLGLASQKCVANGKVRVRADGEIEAEFIPLDKGYYRDTFWATQDQLLTDFPSPTN